MAQMTVVYWRDIPAQVIVKSGRKSAKRQLSERFETAMNDDFNTRGALTYYFKLRNAGRTANWLDFISERGMEPRPHCSFPDLSAPDVVTRDRYLDTVAAGLDAGTGKTSLTMFEFSDLAGVREHEDGEGGTLRESVESSLGAWSVDGSVGVLTAYRAEKVTAWTRFATDGTVGLVGEIPGTIPGNPLGFKIETVRRGRYRHQPRHDAHQYHTSNHRAPPLIRLCA